MTFSSFLDDLAGTLEELSIDYGTIQSILSSLQHLQDDMPKAKDFGSISEHSFGTLPAGTEMGFHTNAAHEYLLASLTEMMETLGLLDDGIKVFRQGTNHTDEFSEQQLRKITGYVNKVDRLNKHHQTGGHQS